MAVIGKIELQPDDAGEPERILTGGAFCQLLSFAGRRAALGPRLLCLKRSTRQQSSVILTGKAFVDISSFSILDGESHGRRRYAAATSSSQFEDGLVLPQPQCQPSAVITPTRLLLQPGDSRTGVRR